MALQELHDLLQREQTLAAEALSLAATVDPVDALCAAIEETGSEPPAPPSPPQLSPNATLEELLFARSRQELIRRLTTHTRTIRHLRQAKAQEKRAAGARRVEQKLNLGKDRKRTVKL